ncbi:MAG TPA: ribbon-helix-helix domain-containing protein [Candidatus Sulfotelmatobacter sp.]
MSHTLTIRLTEELLNWLKETSRKTGVPVGRLVREQLESAKASRGKQKFLRHVGAIKGGAPDLSSRKGYSPR